MPKPVTRPNPIFDPQPQPRRGRVQCATCKAPAAKGQRQCNACLIKAKKTPKKEE